MKKIILCIAIIGFASSAAYTQIRKPVEITKKKIEPAKTTPPPQTPPAPPPVYTLTSARVSIRTGSDNKEFPSKVYFGLYLQGVGYAMEQPGGNMRNEMKVNSTTEFGLQSNSQYPQAAKLLSTFQKNGLALVIRYQANIFTDAWKIEGVSLTLEFKDQNGNLHPTLGNKTIVFNNASGFLNASDWTMSCRADASFAPLTSSITQ